jgi:hypothetical protein
VRGVEAAERTSAWAGTFRVLEGRTVRLHASEKLPFLGVAADPADAVVAFLKEQGFVVETGPEAAGCATYLGSGDLRRARDHVQLLELIESAVTPMVRFWRWPSNARSALCVSGDLDALSLTDYAARLFAL